MRRVMATLVVVLCMIGCGADEAHNRLTTTAPPATTPVGEAPPAAPPPTTLVADFPQSPFNAVTGASPKYQATQVLSAQPPQSVLSRRYAMTVSMF